MSNKAFMLISRGEYMNFNVGVIREDDDVGRLVIPKEIRERLHLQGTVELLVTQEGLLIRNMEYEMVKIKE